jgi:hypothetical protein
VGCGGGRGKEACGGEGRGEGSGCQGRGSCRGLAGPRPGAVSDRGQEVCGSTPPAKRTYRGVWKPRFVQLSPAFSLFFILLVPFLSKSSPSGAVTVMGAVATDAVVGTAPGPAPVSEPRTPEGVPEDIMESEGEPEVFRRRCQRWFRRRLQRRGP